MQQPIQQNFRDDDEDAGVGVDAAVPGDEADVLRVKAPFDGQFLRLAVLLLRQRDERCRVISHFPRVQRLEDGRLGDERLAGSGRAQTSTPW